MECSTLRSPSSTHPRQARTQAPEGKTPTLPQAAPRRAIAWEKLPARWYKGETREVLACSDISLWYTPGKPPVPIRWVMVRDPHGEFEDTPILCSDLDATAQQIIEWFVSRWNIEVTFEELRAHLGMETQRQR